MKFDYVQNMKFNGLNHSLDLEQDKIKSNIDEQLRLIAQQQLDAERNRTLNGILDPNTMDINLRDVPNESGISFDPNDITFTSS